MTRRTAALAAVVTLLALLSGCATIPTSGPVETAPAQPAQVDPGFGFQPAPPAEGARPESIVRGFIQASSAGGDYEVAKQFLTAQFAKSWPHDGVLVHTASWETVPVSDDRVDLKVPLSARVDEDGVFTPSSGTESPRFDLVQVRGQWRISNGPDELVLAQPAFQRIFAPAYLQFFDADYKRIVPDLRWFPSKANRVAKIISALLAGPARALVGVTRSALPASATLASPVRISDDQVSVDLALSGARPDEQSTDRMQQQLTASLRDSRAGSVLLSINGRTVPAAPELDVQQLSVTDPVGVVGGRFGTITASGAVQEDRTFGARIMALKPTAITFSARQNLAAVLTGGGQVMLLGRTGGAKLIDSRRGLLPPTMDQDGWTYTVPADDPSGLQARDSAGRLVQLQSDLGGTGLLSIEVSTDGTRMLVLTETSDGPEAYVAGIERDSNGQPIGLSTDQFPVALGVDRALDATWVDQSSVGVLVTAGASGQTVVVQQLGGVSSTLGLLANGAEVVGATKKEDLRVLQGTGAVVRPASTSNTWTQEFGTSVKIDVLAVQR